MCCSSPFSVAFRQATTPPLRPRYRIRVPRGRQQLSLTGEKHPRRLISVRPLQKNAWGSPKRRKTLSLIRVSRRFQRQFNPWRCARCKPRSEVPGKTVNGGDKGAGTGGHCRDATGRLPRGSVHSQTINPYLVRVHCQLTALVALVSIQPRHHFPFGAAPRHFLDA